MSNLYKSKVYLDEENIIHWDCELEEPPGQEEAMQEIMNDILKLAQKVPGKTKVIVDFRKASSPTAKTRKIVIDTVKSGLFEKVAIWGTSVFIRTIAKFIISGAGVDFIKLFDSEEEALKWLKQ